MKKRKNLTLLAFLLAALLILISSCNPLTKNSEIINGTYSGKILFDNAHLQTAGNADWTITGGFSDFADDLKELGFTVNQWGSDDTRKATEDKDSPITYSELEKYDVYVIPEPNVCFTSSEQDAIIDYIKNGGSVFFIADHKGADRNSNGWDAVEAFNGFKDGTHTIETKEKYSDDFVGKLGFRFREVNYSGHPITNILYTPITKNVKEVGEWSGSTEYIMNSSKIYPAIYLSNKDYGPYVIYGAYGKGKFVAIGDSSPIDDGSGAPGNKLYKGYQDYDDALLCKNIIIWLSQK